MLTVDFNTFDNVFDCVAFALIGRIVKDAFAERNGKNCTALEVDADADRVGVAARRCAESDYHDNRHEHDDERHNCHIFCIFANAVIVAKIAEVIVFHITPPPLQVVQERNLCSRPL